jgi:RimJ/RimL family protein N-acetyltransferase
MVDPCEQATAFGTVSSTFGASPPLALSDGAVEIRQFESQDLPALYQATAESINQLCTWMNWCTPNYSIDDCRRFLADATTAWELGSEFNFAIIDREHNLLHGSIALNRIDRTNDSANVGYWVRRTQAGRGIASRALRLVSRFAFGGLALERLEILVPEGNVASRRVAEKAGAIPDGNLGRELLLHGQACTAQRYLLQLDRR